MADSALQLLRVNNPAEYERLLAEQKRYSFRPHSKGQQLLVDDETRFIVARAGRRYGKTKAAARKVVRKALRNNNVVIWWVGNVYKNTRRGYREVLRQLPPQFLAKPAPPPTANDLILQLKNGTRIEFYSGTNPDAMAGEGVYYVVVDEAALQEEKVWSQIIRPTLMDHGGGALLISTPRGRNWFWRLDRRGNDPADSEWQSYHFTSMDNPLIDRQEFEEMRKDLPEVFFKQEVLAEFIAGSASIFRLTDDSIMFDRHHGSLAGEQVFMGVDLGSKEDFTVLTAARASDRMPVYLDRFNSIRWKEQKQLIRDAHDELEARGAFVTIAVDATGVGDPIFEDLEDMGLDVIGVKFTNDWKNKAVRRLATDLESGAAYVLQEQVEEFEAYEYEITPSGRIAYSAPDGEHDDYVSAKLLEHWALVTESFSDDPVREVRTDKPPEEDLPSGPRVDPLTQQANYEEVRPDPVTDLLDRPDVWTRRY